jgi:hypothetical protein
VPVQATEVVQAFEDLPDSEKDTAAAVIAASRPLPDPPASAVGPLWLMTVGAFVVLMVGGALLLYLLVQDDKSTEVIGPLVTGALGVLAGLLAPSPISQGSK